MATHAKRFREAQQRAIRQAIQKQASLEPDTERDAYCKPDYCPPTLRSPVWVPIRSALTGQSIVVEWSSEKE